MSDESVFDEASVGCRIADSVFLDRNRESLGNADPTRLIDSLISGFQQMSVMFVTLRPLVEEAAALSAHLEREREKNAQNETTARQDREKYEKEIKRHIARVDSEVKKVNEAMKIRAVAEARATDAEARLVEVQEELRIKTEAARHFEEELARLVEERAEESERLRVKIDMDFLIAHVQPGLRKMRKDHFNRGYKKGFETLQAEVVKTHPDLKEEMELLQVDFGNGEKATTAAEEPQTEVPKEAEATVEMGEGVREPTSPGSNNEPVPTEGGEVDGGDA